MNWSVDKLDLESLRLDNIPLSPLDVMLGENSLVGGAFPFSLH